MIRVGFGYDVHRLQADRRLILGGIEIPYEKGLVGHSDADVLSHAIGDALLGAAALRDIGYHFPPNDERFKDISSLVILQEIRKLLHQVGAKIEHVDSTIVAENPEMAPYIENMRALLAETLAIEVSQMSVKATTTEGLGFTGTGQGIAVYAVATILQKD